jgi:hypothetical protein
MVQIPLKAVGAAVAPAAVQGPNHGLQATAYSLRSYVASASGGA